jgi:hypothetical protein
MLEKAFCSVGPSTLQDALPIWNFSLPCLLTVAQNSGVSTNNAVNDNLCGAAGVL